MQYSSNSQVVAIRYWQRRVLAHQKPQQGVVLLLPLVLRVLQGLQQLAVGVAVLRLQAWVQLHQQHQQQ
jgi:hypothetical protein